MKIEDVINKSITGDVIEVLPQLPEKSVHCIVTSPPYWVVRDYKIEATPWPEIEFTIFGMPIKVPAMLSQLGQEEDHFHFIGHMVHVFRLAKRVLRDDGTLWMNMGDCYNSKSGAYNESTSYGKHSYISEGTNKARTKVNRNIKKLKSKDMVGIPWMLAFALRDDGWYLRSDIIWNKPNPMPESVYDRPTKSHEYIFLFSKKKRYFYDHYAISTEIKDSSIKRLMQDIENQEGSDRAAGGMKHNGPMKAILGKQPSGWAQNEKYSDRDPRYKTRKRTELEDSYGINGKGFQGHSGYFDPDGNLIGNGRANKKSVWTITTKGTTIDHYATYPEEVPLDPIKAGTSEHGVCSACGAPYKRTMDKKLVKGKGGCNTLVVDERDINADAKSAGSNRAKDGHIPGHHLEYSNFSWVAGCSCKAEIAPAIVMDVFAGHNTTGLVARKLNRNFIAIDKSVKYNGQSEKRLLEELGMFR